MRRIIVSVFAILLSAAVQAGDAMNQSSMESIVKGIAQQSKGENGVVEFTFNDVRMYLVSDVKHDRMRIISGIVEYKNVTREQIDAMMEANFHTALDARYALSKGVIYAAYIHPMSALNEAEIKSAVLQVSNLARSFGTQYSGGTLSYGKH